MTAADGTDDTIAAIATPPGSGGVGIVRLSGATAIAIVARLLRRAEASFEDRRMVLGRVHDPYGGEVLDEVLAVVMRGPRSFTGEDVAEIHGHGGALNMARLLRAALRAGARVAEPGEFSRRAFARGKIDLVRAEAICDVAGAASERALRVAQAQLAGALGATIGALEQEAAQLRAEVEAQIDFPGEDLDFAPAAALGARAGALGAACLRLARTFVLGRALRDGIEVALVGAPNVGKSSLLNALAGEERAVVSPEPGTTRDYLEARVVWDGVPVTLVDTAGERDSGSVVEQRGLELGRARARRADVLLEVHDATKVRGVGAGGGGGSGVATVARDGEPARLVVVNKVDLASPPPGVLGVSAQTGAGLDALRHEVLASALGHSGDAGEGDVVTSARQASLLEEAAVAALRAEAVLGDGRPLELAAADLRETAVRLGRILGGDVDEALLDAIFRRFCLGK